MISIIKESINEFQKVTWPDKKETIRLTAYVIGVSLGVGLIVTLFDRIFDNILKAII